MLFNKKNTSHCMHDLQNLGRFHAIAQGMAVVAMILFETAKIEPLHLLASNGLLYK